MVLINDIEYSPKDVRKIGETYYIIGETCWKLGGRWKSIDDPDVAFDHTNKCYDLKKNLTYGIISPESWGYFTPTLRSVNSEAGMYAEYNDCPLKISASGMKLRNPKMIIQKHFDLSYSFNLEVPYINKIVEAFKTTPINVTSEVKLLAPLLKGYTFGLEYETCNGTIPKDMLTVLGLIPLKDGSLRLGNGQEPFEYVTPPLSGIKGIQAILDQCTIMQDCCKYDNDCSLHMHIGGLRNDRRVLVALYKLVYSIQQELYDLVPYGKRDPEYFFGANLKSGDKRKNYARLLPDLPSGDVSGMLQHMFQLFSNGYPIEKNYKRGSDHQQKNKWNRYNRYSIVNFEHLLLGQSNTVEFRIFNMSTNGQNVVNLLLICLAIVRYAEAYSNQIINGQKVTLAEVVSGYRNDFGSTSGTEAKNLIANMLTNFLKEAKEANFLYACRNHCQNAYESSDKYFKSNYLLHSENCHLPIPVNPIAPTSEVLTYEFVLSQMEGVKAELGLANALEVALKQEENAEEDDFFVLEDYDDEIEEEEEMAAPMVKEEQKLEPIPQVLEEHPF